jgi:hypothetical protein
MYELLILAWGRLKKFSKALFSFFPNFHLNIYDKKIHSPKILVLRYSWSLIPVKVVL